MKHFHVIARPLGNPEVVINLWACSGEDCTILRRAGKAYVMLGAERLHCCSRD